MKRLLTCFLVLLAPLPTLAQNTTGDCSPVISGSQSVEVVCGQAVGNAIVLEREDGTEVNVSRYATYSEESDGPFKIGSEFKVVNADRSDAFLSLREMNGKYTRGAITNVYFQPVFNETWDGFMTSETSCGEVAAWYNVTGTGIRVVEMMAPDLEICDGRDMVIEFLEALKSARYVLGDNNYRMIVLDGEGRPSLFFVMLNG